MTLMRILAAILIFLLTYVLPVVMLSIFVGAVFSTPMGVITGIAFTALYAFMLFMLWKASKGQFAADWLPGSARANGDRTGTE